MKRYIWTIGLIAFSVPVLIAYYVHGALDRLPQFALVTETGDEQAAASVLLNGDYTGRWQTATVEITTEGSDYWADRSLWQYIDEARFSRDSFMHRLQQEYRGFMRGKGILQGFYEDEEWLAYAEAESKRRKRDETGVTIRIEVLDKGTEQVREISEAFVIPGPFGYLSIQDVQRVGDELHLLTLHSDVCRIYVFDVKDGTLVRESVLDFAAAGLSEGISVWTLPEADFPSPSDVVAFELRVKDAENEAESARAYWAAYSYSTGELFLLPERWQGMLDRAFDLEDHWFSYLSNNSHMLEAAHLNLISKEERTLTVTAEQYGADTILQAELDDGKLVLLLQQGDQFHVVVLDAMDGTLLYRGRVSGEDGEPARHLQVYDLLTTS